MRSSGTKPDDEGPASGDSLAEQVPQIAPRVSEDTDTAIRFVADGSNEFAARGADPGKRALEILDAKEQPDPTAELAPDQSDLLVPVCFCENDSGTSTGRPHHDPPFRASIGRRGRRASLTTKASGPVKNSIAESYSSMISETNSIGIRRC